MLDGKINECSSEGGPTTVCIMLQNIADNLKAWTKIIEETALDTDVSHF